MELGYAITIPTFVLLDANLSPMERLLYGVLVGYTNQDGYCLETNEVLASHMRTRIDGVLKQASVDVVAKMLVNLSDLGYIQMEDFEGNRAIVVNLQKRKVEIKLKAKPIVKKSVDVDEMAKRVLEYLSQSSIVRGYRKVAYKPTEANLKNIRGRIQDYFGEDIYEQCIGIINVKFQDQYFIDNPKYLNPETLFRPSNFERYLNEAMQIKDVHKKIVVKHGMANPRSVEKEEVEVAKF